MTPNISYGIAICLCISSAVLQRSAAQNSLYFHGFYGTELDGDHLFAKKNLGIVFEYSCTETFYIQSYLKTAFGQKDNAWVFNKPSNFVRDGLEYPFSQHPNFDNTSPGIGILKETDSSLFMISNGYQIGRKGKLTSFLKYKLGVGVTLTYLDLQVFSQAGDGYFEQNETRSDLWFVSPAYARGLSTHVSGYFGLEARYKNLMLGISLLPEVSVIKHAAGNRYPLLFSVGLPVSGKSDAKSLSNTNVNTGLRLGFSFGWAYLDHSDLSGITLSLEIGHPIKNSNWSIGGIVAMSHVNGSRYFSTTGGEKYNLADVHDPGLSFNPWIKSGIPDKSTFLTTYPMRTDRSFELDISPMVSYNISLKQRDITLSLGGVLAYVHKTYIADSRQGDLYLFSGELFGDDIFLISPYFAYYLDLGMSISSQFQIIQRKHSSFGIFGRCTYLSERNINYSVGLSIQFY